jgi:hypothetical protein
MDLRIVLIERGPAPRGLKKAYNNASKKAWLAAGTMWHTTFRDLRFSKAHALKAGYALRQGEQSGLIQSAFFKSYTGQKLKKWHHKNPLQWSGETRSRVKTASITVTATHYLEATSWTSVDMKGGGCRIAYPGASKFNYRRSGSAINMADEFRRITEDEKPAIGRTYEAVLDTALNQYSGPTFTKVT